MNREIKPLSVNMANLVDNKIIPLYDAYLFCKLSHKEQDEIANNINTMSHQEYKNWLAKAKKENKINLYIYKES